MFWILTLYWIFDLQIFLSIKWVAFLLSLWYLLMHKKIITLLESNLSILFLLLSLPLGSYPRCHWQCCEAFVLCFLLRVFFFFF